MNDRDPFEQLGPVRGPEPGFAQELLHDLNEQNHLDNEAGPPRRGALANNDRDIQALDEQIQLEEEMNLLGFEGSERRINDMRLIANHHSAAEIFKIICKGFWLAGYFIGRFALPLASIAFTIYMVFSGQDYYTLQQVVVIMYSCVAMLVGIQHALIVFLFNRGAKMVLTLILVFCNFSIWDEFHNEGFFNIPVVRNDFNYRANAYLFFSILILNIGMVSLWILFISGVLIFLLVKSIRDRHRFNQEKKILVNLLKVKLTKWKKTNPEKAQKIIANHTTEKANETAFFCCICYMPINEESVMTELPECNHIFHHSCVMHWLDKNPKCPYCRSDTIQALKRKLRVDRHQEPEPVLHEQA
jgi:hypothetical protein